MTMLAILATTGTATASKLSVANGYSLVDGTFLTAMLAGIASIITAISTLMWANHRNAKKREGAMNEFMPRCECEQHRLAIAKRIDELGPALNRIFVQLRENDKKSEDRAMQMHRRIDPVLEKTAANAAELQMVKAIIGKVEK